MKSVVPPEDVLFILIPICLLFLIFSIVIIKLIPQLHQKLLLQGLLIVVLALLYKPIELSGENVDTLALSTALLKIGVFVTFGGVVGALVFGRETEEKEDERS